MKFNASISIAFFAFGFCTGSCHFLQRQDMLLHTVFTLLSPDPSKISLPFENNE